MGVEVFDVVIVGAGLSGIGTAVHLQEKCPTKSYVILEGREAMGGTWDLFRYPGVRSDSDMYTLGYSFKPWPDASFIAEGERILDYIRKTAVEYQVNQHIRYQHFVIQASWSTAERKWTITAENRATDETVQIRCNFMLMCSGYYSYEKGYAPDFAGQEDFSGLIVHPQKWPQALDYSGKTVVVIGSGATAVTLIPAMADRVKHITMLQRSPSYLKNIPNSHFVISILRTLLPQKLSYKIIRKLLIKNQSDFYQRTRDEPEVVRKEILDAVRGELGGDYDIDTHFSPSYEPWDQRLCYVPEGDFFEAIRSGKASVATDHIERFTENGILLQSGEELPADIIITATGLNLKVAGGVAFVIDGQPIDFADTFSYKGIMFSNVPNLIYTFGYVNIGWTLRADLIAEFACRLISAMDTREVSQCTPRLRESDKGMETQPFITDFSPSYMQRMMDQLPKQGDRAPWLVIQNYIKEKPFLLESPLDDGVLTFEGDLVSFGKSPKKVTAG